MDKRNILDQIINHLKTEIASLSSAAKDARAYATDAETKAEDRYDTRATESSYLADGQGKLAAEVGEALAVYEKLNLRDFAPGELVGLTALVEINGRVANDYYFLGPRAGGLEIEIDGQMILVVTPQSPLGRTLLGQAEGAAVHMPSGRDAKILKVT